jgi:perosamine synthetase
MRLFRSHGVAQRRYWHEVPGHNFRLTNMQAAIGCAQFECISEIERERIRVYEAYKHVLADLPQMAMQTITAGVTPLMWAVGIRLLPRHFPQGRDEVMQILASAGIETRPGFHAASEMVSLYHAPSTPVAAQLASEIISLPSSPTVTDQEVFEISEIIRQCLN